MREGKLEPDLLRRLLRDFPLDARTVLGPGVGRDAAVVEFGERFLVLTTDPVSFATERTGWYAVHVSANDIACLGAEPRWFLASVLAPPEIGATALEALFDDLRLGCRETGAALVGGHTEITAAVRKPLVVGTMVGEVAREGLRRSDAARPGDALIQVGAVALEGTALLARALPERLRTAGLAAGEIDAARALLFEPGISVLPFARAAWSLPGVHSLHDPTEGGIATACWEVAQAAGVGIVVVAARIALHPLTARVCRALDANPLGLLASGSLLITVDAVGAEAVIAALRRATGAEVRQIGRLGGVGETAILDTGREICPLPRFARDEVARVLARAPEARDGADHP